MGTCKLCRTIAELQDSHLAPSAMYKYLREPWKQNPNPIVIDRNKTSSSSKQVKDYVLCRECEDLFNKNGENWILRQVWNGREFPLLDRLNVAVQHHALSEALAFSGKAVGIDTEKLGYFALSMVWRAGAHVWTTPFGQKTNLLDLGSYEEPIRQYLLGKGPFPSDVAVLAHVCTDSISANSFILPVRISAIPWTSFTMLTLGIYLHVLTGAIPPELRTLCCVSSPNRLILQRDCTKKTAEVFTQLMATSTPTKALS